MAKIGDTVRFLNAIGGGKITRIEGNIAYVDDDGFETPVLIKELVVVMPSGHDASKGGYKKMFDQSAFDEGRTSVEAERKIETPVREEVSVPELPVEETDHGEKPNLLLVFEPSDVKQLDKSCFSAVIVNDSNFFVDFTFLRRAETERGWTLVFRGTVAPNELMDVATLTHADLVEYEKVAIQCVMYKKDKTFTLQAPVSFSRKLDLTKFHKFHCFRPGIYFDTPVLEVSIVKDGIVARPLEVKGDEIVESIMKKREEKRFAGELAGKYRVDQRGAGKHKENKISDTKVLPLIEVDLHIGELTDTISGMEPKDMLEMQLSAVRRHMRENCRRIGQKLVFIHGKGEGVLRKAVLDLLKKEYPKAELQDASFREYGFGATLVTIH